ncbi:DUF3891 family protein [Skermanella rosea]|uniref:DUF3891 family protein n=1 Tax=Skermanella rosea TaxID=1817965 RepID=UPI0019338DE7|nr:DUF3891 family protein [Skermanella rosea]UEM02507.1 DUF3891 family protein [Skermanella rosea]
MLFRKDGDGVIAIGQPSHSWLAGQFVRAWGSDGFARPSPYEEVCLGAELHDIGWLSWETAPTLNRGTGRPHDFRELGPPVHAPLWTEGVERARVFGLYPALLVSLHADTIYSSYFDIDKAPPEDARLVRDFLEDQHAFQRAALEALGADPRLAADVAPEAVERNRRLVAATDRMSLEVCWGIGEGGAVIPDVPTVGKDRTSLIIRARNGDPGVLTVDPWPFAADRVEAVCEGKRLRGNHSDETRLRIALRDAERVGIHTVLLPR